MVIRPERPGDAEAIHAVHAAAFPGPDEARLVDALRAAGRLSLSLVAEADDGHVIGHVAFSPVSVDGASDGLGLAPLAVAPARQRRGVGHLLVTEGLAAAERAGAGFVVVLGDPDYYGRFGFNPAGDWGLSDEYGGGPAFQVLELRPGAVPRGAGLVRYAPEFGLFGEPDPEQRADGPRI